MTNHSKSNILGVTSARCYSYHCLELSCGHCQPAAQVLTGDVNPLGSRVFIESLSLSDRRGSEDEKDSRAG